MNKLSRFGRRILIVLASLALLVGGLVLLVLPGPGLLLIAAALLLMGTEFDWAKRWGNALMIKIKRVAKRSPNATARKSDTDTPS